MADDTKKPAPPVAPAVPAAAPKVEAKAAAPAPAAADAEPEFAVSRGAQVILDGEALDAARGGAGNSIEENTAVKKELEDSGEVADGYSVDGSTRTGKPAKEVVLEEHPSGVTPAKKD